MKYTGGGAKLNTTASGGSIAFFAPEWLRPFKGHKRLKLAVVQEEAVPGSLQRAVAMKDLPRLVTSEDARHPDASNELL